MPRSCSVCPKRRNSIAGLGATIERQRTEAKNWRAIAEEAERAAGTADDEADRESVAAEGHHATVERVRKRRTPSILSEPAREPSVQEAIGIAGGSANLFAFRALFEELDRRLTGETSTSDVAAKPDRRDRGPRQALRGDRAARRGCSEAGGGAAHVAGSGCTRRSEVRRRAGRGGSNQRACSAARGVRRAREGERRADRR